MSQFAEQGVCVSAVIVTHHSDAVLMKALHALARQPELKDIFVVDNGSNPSPVVPTRLGNVRIELRCNIDNPGFAVGCNQGAAAALSDYLLFVNPDCFLHDGALAAMLKVFAQQPRVGVVGGYLLEADGRLQACTMAHLPRCFRCLRNSHGLAWWAAIYLRPMVDCRRKRGDSIRRPNAYGPHCATVVNRCIPPWARSPTASSRLRRRPEP